MDGGAWCRLLSMGSQRVGHDWATSLHFTSFLWYVSYCLASKLCLTLCDPMDCSPPGSSIHRISQVRLLEWVAVSFSRGSSRPRGQTQVSRIVDKRFTIWATREVIKEYIQCLATSKSKALPEPLERTQPCKKVGFSPVRPFQNTIRFLICIILSHYVCNNLWWNNRKLP